MIKYINRALIMTLVMLMTLSAIAGRTGTFKGRVLDESNQPMAGVHVTSSDGKVSTITDAEGRFELSLQEGVQISMSLDGRSEMEVILKEGVYDYHFDEKEEVIVPVVPKVTLPFGQLEKNRIVGSVSTIDASQELLIDQRTSIGSALNGKVSGVFGSDNILGLPGNAIYVIDGIPRDVGYYNLTEVESISILKDPVSRMMYGAQADQGVILITTKRGSAQKNEIRVRGEYGVQTAVQLPEYLNGADYMEAYNQANINDGKPALYTQTQIDGTRAGSDPLLYPDLDYMDEEFLRDSKNFFNFNADAAGGNEFATYFVNLGMNHSEGWNNLGTMEQRNVFNVRANTDFQLFPTLKMNLDAVAVFDQGEQPNGDYWSMVENNLPTSIVPLIPVNSLTDPSAVDGANLYKGQYLLGGTSNFDENIYGELERSGDRKTLNRMLQVNTGLDWDLSAVTEGLSASGAISFDFFNQFASETSNTYAVYSPDFLIDQSGADSLAVVKFNEDQPNGEEVPQADGAFFQRRVGLYGTLDYTKKIGVHAIDMTALAYQDTRVLIGQSQDQKNMHYGIRANYMYDNRYVAEFSGAYQGTQRLSDDRYTFSPSFGLGWIVSNEGFMTGGLFDYLKLRGTFGLLKNDNWNDYFLQETFYSTGGWYDYENGGSRNRELNIDNVSANIGWQKRMEFNAGFDAALLDNALTIEASYFNSRGYDNVTLMSNTTPDIVGYSFYENYNSDQVQGIELAANYRKSFGDFQFNLGTRMIGIQSEVLEIDEPLYKENSSYRSAIGNTIYGRYGYVADGLYAESDFNGAGELSSSLPTPTFGSVQPGDIKYEDLNNDGVINVDDQKLIGSYRPDFQYSVILNMTYKGFGLYALGVGQTGQDQYRNSSYHWVYGNRKYSAAVNEAYGPSNKDVNATMPRLSSTQNNNNYRNSTYWMYENNSFTVPVIQLSYTFEPKESKGFEQMTVFLKGNNLVRINKNGDLSDLRIGREPVSQGYSIGVSAIF
ncbi:SusC/RagA family TonB-linked outer membrane protein [Reichenbachiella ulvae]|uniref:SusC/RagA family TonB-linked outer membrane protein n=1 Tax=Reichenbachiella ulvae TaxID=2980104 RepID=A0ABT3D005_9BACT|nr:SusC/RagA family TonB-linked outer membrane protein [Reichenbachiella ulvae]MCV9389270.1 SusC/RagA family TonB-linked outer membrane protein [Reichenbachiella ulvae]